MSDSKAYMQVWDYDVKNVRFTVANFNNETTELSDFVFTDKDDDPYTIQSEYVANEYDLYESHESIKRITNIKGNYIYIFGKAAILS